MITYNEVTILSQIILKYVAYNIIDYMKDNM